MTPDAPARHNPDPAYLRGLVVRSGLSQRAVARALGISARMVRYYLADPETSSYRPAPYVVQFAMEMLAK